MVTCDWLPGCPHPARHRVGRSRRPGLLLQVCDPHLEHAQREGYRHHGPADSDRPPDEQELRTLARELLDAEAAYRTSPTIQASYRLDRARRRLTEVLVVAEAEGDSQR